MTPPAPSLRSPLRRRSVVLVVLAVLLSMVLAACGGEDKPEDRPQSQPVQGGKQLAALWPLTGLPVKGETPRRPVLVVKIDNTSNSRPQYGLNKADLVTEELVEGGMTRLAAFFYSKLPKVAGPVRSMRASDLGIVKPAHAVVAASGAAPPTVQRFKKAKVTFIGEGGPGYYREGSRRAPYNLMVNMQKLAKSTRKKARVPASYLPWGSAEAFRAKKRARSFDAVFSRSHTTSWRYRGGKYVNTTSMTTKDRQFRPDSVLVLRVRQGDAGYLDPGGNKVPETLFKGTGKAQLFHGGKVVAGTWHKKDARTPVKLRTASGKLQVPAGHVWVELVPRASDGGNVVIGR